MPPPLPPCGPGALQGPTAAPRLAQVISSSLVSPSVEAARGPNIGGLVLKEEKVEQEVPGGPQATSFVELNPEQGKPQCI
jgi:hypothetical protein